MVRRMAGVIEIEGLRKEYRRLRGGRTIAVDGLDLEVPEGGVFGFLGPNGAGKTTTIRCLLGLVAPSAGTLRLLGSEVPKGLPGVIGKVGAIVETPALFPRFSGRRNLQILARIDGIGKATIEEVLTRVGLADRGRRRRQGLFAGDEAAPRYRGGADEGSTGPASWTSRRTASTPPASWRCANSCVPSAPRDAPCSSRATSCPRSSTPPIRSRSSRRVGSIKAGGGARGARRAAWRRRDREGQGSAGGPRRADGCGPRRHARPRMRFASR